MEFSSKPITKCTEKTQSSISTHPFSDVPSEKHLNHRLQPTNWSTVFVTTLVFQD